MQRIPEPIFAIKETVDINILITSTNGDKTTWKRVALQRI